MTTFVPRTKAGVSMVEVVIAMAITAFMCAGLYSMGLSLRRSSELTRISTEAQTFAREGVEEIISKSLANLAMPEFTLDDPVSIKASTGAEISRTVEVVWHDISGVMISAPDTEGYAEVHVHVAYPAPSSGQLITDTYSTLIN